MTKGGWKHPTGWSDMSNFLVHFARRADGIGSYNDMMGILGSGRIEGRSRYGIGRNAAPKPDSQIAVCLSEIPLHEVRRLADRRSRYGIVFRKNFVMAHGGNPILYAYPGQQPTVAIEALMAAAKADPTNAIWSLTPFVDVPSSGYRFEWEREWRVAGDLNFEPSDVAFLLIPEEKHALARFFFEDAEEEGIGPDYPCPFIDAGWDAERLQPALAAAAVAQV